MEEHTIVDSSVSATINAPLEKIDLPAWCFTLPDEEYQGCSPAHVATGATTARDGRRRAINVEVIGGTLMVQHFTEQVAEQHHLVLQSVSDLFTPAGRTKTNVRWELSVKAIGAAQCEFTNHFRSWATPEFWEFLARQGIPFDVFSAQRQPIGIAHNKQETPLFALSIERHAHRRAAAAPAATTGVADVRE
jgi:hypothetical protein